MNRIALIIIPLLLFACKSKQQVGKTAVTLQSNKRPNWVDQRPVNNMNYVGIGRASKFSNPADYLQVAKKEALQDMVGEIKVNVSTNSILSQYQNNSNFNQQFFSDTRLVAQEFLQDFTVVDSWENKDEYWIYYTLSKAEYEAQKRKQIYIASQQALELMQKADRLNRKDDYIAIFKLRVKALAHLQSYLNEAVEVEYYGKQVYIVNELIAQLQDQLFQITLNASPTQMNASAGKAFEKSIETFVSYRNKDSVRSPIKFVPLIADAGAIRLQGSNLAESNAAGEAIFGVSRTFSREPIQIITIKPNLDKLIRSDSLNLSLRTILMRLETPTTQVRIKVEPLRIYIESSELNQGKNINYAILEPAIKKKLGENGCTFVSSLVQADYKLEIIASTKDLGAIWGNMQQATLDMEIILKDAKTSEELMHESLRGVQGFQNNKEKAGLDAYKNALSQFPTKIYPQLEKALYLQ
jgi:PBP1b-binding outer membrane lipoprotein LpoB